MKQEDGYFLVPLQDRVMFPSVRSQLKLSPQDFAKLEDFVKDSGVNQIVVSGIIGKELKSIGVLCRIIARDANSASIHIEGQSRVSFTVRGVEKVGSIVRAKIVSDIEASNLGPNVIQDLATKVNEFVRASSSKQSNLVVKFPTQSSPSSAANIVAVALLASGSITVAEAQSLLEQTDVDQRLSEVKVLLTRATEAARIKQEVNESIARKHTVEMRQHLIRRQIAELQAQLKSLSGDENEEDLDDVAKLRKKLDSLALPEEVAKIVKKEFNRLDAIQSHHPEYPGIVTYLEVIAQLPWPSASNAKNREINIQRAKAELDSNHFSLEKVKTRVLEFLAVEKLRGGCSGPNSVLCLYGPPGVGKTSIAESIARSMDRKFLRISLSGVRDESELRGHRKTYIGAMAGLIIQSLIRTGVNNPVILLDEIDKVSSIGNPAARAGSGGAGGVLLELLDPEQNSAFRDAFLNFGFDLSKCFFICTCNSLSAVSRPLLDRLDVVTVEGYTDREKIEIAKRHLLEKQLEMNGLKKRVKISIPDDVYEHIIAGYTHEAGVRSLNRKIGDICRHFAMIEAEKNSEESEHAMHEISVSIEQIRKILGPAIPEGPIIPSHGLPVGVSMGLAVSGAGGDLLFIESVITGKSSGDRGAITVTGQLGDVMKESVRTAMSLLMARSLNRFANSHEMSVYRNIDPSLVRTSDIHVHFPTGSVQKDGPSAGISTSIALASLFSGISPRSDLASTGEITLRGDVLPIGGVKQKLMAAHRAGLTTVILPWANKPAIEDVPADVLRSLNVVFVKTIDEVMRIAFPHIEDAQTVALNKSSL
jgi:ATP-dependent Lon protease